MSLIDAVTAQKAAIQSVSLDILKTAVADINGDLSVTIFDAISIQKLSLQ